jgi:cobalt transporter subunit CbtB
METTHASVRSDSSVTSSATASRLLAIACVGLFGLGLVWAAGFANAEALHNAAHDSRHSLVFPCH